MKEVLESLASRIDVSRDSVVFHAPQAQADALIALLDIGPVEHPGRPGVFSRAFSELSLPVSIRLRRIKVWFPADEVGDAGMEPASSG